MQAVDHVDAGLARAQAVVADDERRLAGLARGQRQQLVAAFGRDHAQAPAFEQQLQAQAAFAVVLGHEHEAAGVGRQRRRRCLGRGQRLARQRHRHREHRAPAHARAQRQRMAQQRGRAAHDGQAQAQPLGAVALGVAELVELPEHLLLFGRRNADAGVPHLDAQRVGARAAAADEHAAARRVADRVLHQVAQHAVE
ncbi:hypothetical protein FQZ97_611520 [compost metagenome]